MSLAILDVWTGLGPFGRGLHLAMLLLSATSVFIAGERSLAFARAQRASRRYARQIAARFVEGEVSSIARPDVDPGYIGRVIEAGIAAWRTCPCADEQFTLAAVARALERQGRRELQQLRRGRGVLKAVCAAAPCTGLLGTLMGIATAFERAALDAGAHPATLWLGVAQALLTTAYGLSVAIPAACALMLSSGWIEARAVDIAESSSEFLDFVARRARLDALAPRD